MSAALERIEAWQAAASAGREVELLDGLVREVREQGAPSRYRYGARGELTEIAEPDGTRWAYAYAADGRLLSVLRGGKPHASYRYDAAGRLAGVSGPHGSREHAYDDAGRLAQTLLAGAGTYAYRYDALGRVSAARCDHEETRFAYDASGRVTGVEQAVDGVVLEAAFDFDGAGRLAATRFPRWGVELAYRWDERGRPRSLSWRGAELASFGYMEGADTGKLAWRETADGVRAESRHDAADGRPVRIELRRGAERFWERALAYGASGLLEREGTRAYRYDELGRLEEASEGERRWSFAYDAMDEVSEEGPSPRAGRVEVDAADRVQRVMSGRTERIYRYDAAGELVEVRENGAALARFRYDHKGRLLLKETPAGSERYLYAPDDGLLAIADASGAPRAVFLRFPTGLVGMIDFTRGTEGEPVFFHGDGRGNLVFAGREEGVAGPFAADPFGLPLEAPKDIPYFHRERAFHAEAGLYRMGARWYAPALRRFLTPDSYTGAPDDERLVNPFVPASGQRARRAQILGEWLKQPRVRNRHAYCANDPVNRFDPNGHWSFGGVLLSLLGAIWTLPNTLFGLAIEILCLVGEVVRWLVWMFSFGNVSWETPGFDAAASGRLNAFALVFTGGWLGSFESLLGITFGNVIFVNRAWKQDAEYLALPAVVAPPAYGGEVTIPREQVLYEHELRHVNQYSWFGPFFHLGLPLFGVFEWDLILNGYLRSWVERDAREHAGY